MIFIVLPFCLGWDLILLVNHSLEETCQNSVKSKLVHKDISNKNTQQWHNYHGFNSEDMNHQKPFSGAPMAWQEPAAQLAATSCGHRSVGRVAACSQDRAPLSDVHGRAMGLDTVK